MIDRQSEVGRGKSPADPLRFLRRLLGREPSARQEARVLDLQRRLNLASGDSIFVIVSILEAYLELVEVACLDVRTSIRRILLAACLTAVASAAVMATPLYILDPNVRSTLGWGSTPAGASKLPFRAFLDATLDRTPDADIVRIASSKEAMTILQALPRASDEQLAPVAQYLQGIPVSKTR